MTISEFKDKISGLNIATGAKKVALAVAITSALALATAPAVVGVSTGLRVIEIKGEQVPEIISLVGKVNAHYNTALNNIAGYSNKYENSFAYNGVDKYTGESVWLSFADDTKQENLEGALSLYESLSNDKAVVLECEDPTVTYRPSRKEVQMLQNLGYTDIQARSARVSEATITLLDLSYTK